MLFFFASIGVTNLQAVTYTTIADGNWTSPSTWLGGVVPGSTIAAADIVNIGHVVTYNNANDLEVFGMVNIVSGTFRTALTGNGENRSVFIRPGGEWNMCNAKMILPIFSCGYECYTGANKSGNFSNNGGSIIIHNSTVHVAQNWEDVSNAGTGTRTFNGGCLIVGENFSNKGSEDLYDGICMEMGWHGSGSLKNEYRMTFQDANVLRLLGSGSFENVPSSPHGIFGGPGTPDISVLYISNGNMINSAAWTASVLNFCINGGSVSGSMTADFTNDVTNNDTPAACATAMDTTCTNCPQGTCMLVVTAEILDTISCTPGCDGSATAVIQEGTGTISCGTGAMTTYLWNTMPPQMTETATNLCAGTYTVTVTDAGGCSATASVTLEAPTNCCELITTCPPANGGTFDCVEDVPLPDINLVTVIDSCGPIVITVDDDTTGTGCGIDTMFITRDYFITDGTNIDTCTQLFRVVDDEGPMITCPANLTVSCLEDVPACPVDFAAFDALPGASATDNCDPTLTYSCSTGPLLGGACGGTITRTHTVTDDCGNSATCNQTITVDDNTPPVITCPANATVSCVADVPACPVDFAAFDALPGASAADLCDPTLTYACSTGPLVGGPCGGTITRTHTVTDDCGNSATCNQTFTVDDNTPPVITCPANATVSCVADVPACPVSFAAFDALPGASASDLCDPTLTYACSTGLLVGGPCGGTITRTHTVTDDCGNSATCNQTFTVDDNTPPVITCPTNVTVSCVADVPACPVNFAAFDALPGASASDLCDPTLTYACSTGPLVGGACGGTITRTHTVTDDCGNSATCNQTITVDDNTPPVITCPANVTIGGGEFIPAIDFGILTDFALFTAAGAFNNLGPTIVSGDIGTHVGTITGFPPGVVIGQMHTANGVTAQAAADVAVAYGQLSAMTCGTVLGTTLGNGQVLTPDVYCLGAASTVNLNLVLDAQGDPNAVFIFQINGALSTNALSNVILINGASSCNVYWQVNGAFAAGTNSIFRGNLFAAGAISLNFGAELEGRALSTAGAISTNTNVVNSIAPCGSGEIGMATATDNCGSTLISYSDDITGGACCGEIIMIRTWRATDECGNSATCNQTITILDTTPPVITCPANATVSCEADVPACPVSFAEFDALPGASASDICDSTTLTYSCSTGPLVGGGCGGTITRTHTVTDDCGNSATCTQTFTVDDNTPPVITCPANATVSCVADVPACPVSFAAFDALPGASGSDLCDPTLTYGCSTGPLVGGPCGGTITRTHTVTDDCGNSATCNQTFTVDDNTPPVITCPTNVTVSCVADVPACPVSFAAFDALPGASASDLCDPTLTYACSTGPLVGGACGGTITRTHTVTDDCGNSATCNQTITVDDNTPPVITCPTNITVSCEADVPACPISFAAFDALPGASASDLCDPTLTYACSTGPLVGGACGGTITRTHTVTDDCGNSATCNQTITVDDNTPPVITCPTNVTVSCVADVPACPVSFAAFDALPGAGATDLCDPTLTYACSTGPLVGGGCGGTITRTHTVTDDCGNSATCNQTIMVDDNTPPVITCPTNITVSCEADVPACPISFAAFDALPGASASDLCDATLTYACSTGPLVGGACGGTITRTHTVTDDCGNSATCNQTITVDDNTPPVITCPANATVSCEADVPACPLSFAEFDALVGASGTDNCDPILTYACSTGPLVGGGCGGTITRTHTVTDDCGNSATCTQTFTVDDNTPPTITCPMNVTVQCASLVPPVDLASPITSDNCIGIVTTSHAGDVITNMTCANRFTLTRTYRATDACGNSATCNQIITVFDNTAPMITCPMNVTVQCASLVPPVNTTTVTSSDNCGGVVTITHAGDVVSNMTCVNRFTLTRTYRATDVCGNSATCNQIITVFDNTPPTITCPGNVTVQCANLVPPVNTTLVITSDNCGGTVTVTHVNDAVTNMTCINRFILTRTYRATDACGNSATCAQVITVFDNTPPTITCPPNVTVQCAAQVPPVNPASVITSDNCGGIVTVTLVSDVITNMTCINRFILTRTYRATDACGNSATCAQVITVFDNTPPVIVFVDPLLIGIPNGGTLEVQCFGQDPEWELPTFNNGDVMATDNCAGPVTVVFTDVLIDEGDCDVDGYINRYRLTWTATDACGNSSSLFIFMELIDTIPPVITGVPDDITVSCDEIPEPPTVMATDECLCACIILFDESDPDPGCQDGQIITRTWTAEDDCGNITVEVQNITLIDNEGPEMEMMVPELAGLPSGTVLEYTCNEGGIPAFFDLLSAESVNTDVSCGTAGIITFNDETVIANNCKFWGYIENREFTWEAVDQCGNTTSFSIIARLIDTEEPTLVGVPDTTCMGDPELLLVEAVDNCNNASVIFWDVEIPNPCGDGFAMRRTYEGIDDCGNTVRDTAILIPNDQTPPILEFSNPILAELGFGEVLIIDCSGDEDQYSSFGIGDVTVTDDCMKEMSVEFSEILVEEGDCVDGVQAVLRLVWTATDLCGNQTSLSARAHVVDQTSPVFDETEIEITIGCGDEMPEVSATDNCGEVTITTTDNIIPGDCVYEFDVQRTHVAIDPCGNISVLKQLIHVVSDGPEIEGVVEELCDDLSIPEVTAFDACAGSFVDVTMTEDTLDIPCREGIVVERIWSAVDACGNISEVRQLIILGDETPPEIIVPTNSIIRKFEGLPQTTVFLSQTGIIELLNELNAGSVFVLDDCDQEIDAEFSLVISFSENCAEDGYFERHTYSWIATDVCGNSDQISFTVDIMDDIPPVLLGVPADTVIICEELPAPPVVTSLDFGQAVIVYEEGIYYVDNEFLVIRTWTATDACGNSTSASQEIRWIPDTFLECDILLPGGLVECNSHGVVIGSDLVGGIGPFEYLWEISGEKCFIQSGQNTPEILIYVGWSEVEINLTVTDAFGCTSVCTAFLNCLDPIDNLVVNPGSINPESNPVPQSPNATSNSLNILEHFNIWPNPAKSNFTLSFDSAIDHEVQYVLTNYLGQVVLSDHMKAIKGFNSQKIDVSHLPEGSYLMQVISEKAIRTRTIVLFRN